MLNIKLLTGLFATAVNEAVSRITPDAPPTFYCEELEKFTGPNGVEYVVEITVRRAAD